MRNGFIRVVCSLLVALALVAAGGAADAAPFSMSFDALRTELQRRHDEDYAGTLTRPARRELAAVDASLALIDAPHDGLLADVKTLRSVAKRLAAAFRGEFGAEPGPLAGLLAGTASSVAAEIETAFGTLEREAAALLDPAVKDRVLALAATARAQLDAAAAPGLSAASAASRLKRAVATIAKGVAAIEAGKADRLVCTMNGREYAATSLTAQVSTLADVPYIVIQGFLQNPVTARREALTFVMRAEAGTPTPLEAFTLFGANYIALGTGDQQSQFFFSQFSPKSTFTITGFDAASGTATGTFSCFLQRDGQFKLTMTRGSFRVTGTPLPTKR